MQEELINTINLNLNKEDFYNMYGRNKKIATLTLGCKVNFYDTEAMLELFIKNGYEKVDFEEFADVYLINTCTVTNLSDKKSRQFIRKAKNINKNSIVVATGCYSQVAPDEVSKIEGINLVIGTKDRNKIVEEVQKYNFNFGVKNNVSDIKKEFIFEKLSINNLDNRTRAYLKIQEGCNQYCSYCIIPYARGPIRSREMNDVLEEVETLTKNGFKEIILTGIHVASYGKDLKNTNLLDLLKNVHEIEGVKRIRFSSIEPNVITEEFISEISKMPKICDHFHLSLQSGCDKTLKNMNRKYTTARYKEATEMLRNIMPNVSITTDIIVGFPGETEEDFLETVNFVKEVEFAKVHVFPYSPKKGTKAAIMKDQIENSIKSQRVKELSKVTTSLEEKFIKNMINKNTEVLYEKQIDKNLYEGHSSNYIKVITESEKDLENKIFNVILEENRGLYAISGKI